MNLTEKEAYTKLVTAFTDENVYGDLVDMLAKFSARFLYVEQFMTLGQIMEGSFSRATKLNSCITHAADNFYSVPRGRNRKVLIRNVSVTENITASKYDIISSYGDYDLVYALDYNRAASSTKVNIECYLTLGTGEQEIQGTGKLYLDIPDTNISEDIIVYDKDYPENKFTLTRDMIDLQEGSETTIAVLTQPNYSVRLWKATPFATDKTYVIKYLKCPDTNIEPLELTEIVNIPKLLFTPPASGGNSEIKETESAEYPLASLDDIYLYTITKVKFGNTIKTTDQIAALVKEYFPEFLGFNVDVNIKGSVNNIDIYYVTDQDAIVQDDSYNRDDGNFNYQKTQAFKALLKKSYFVTSDINFIGATIAGPDIFDDDSSDDESDEDTNGTVTETMTLNIIVHMKEVLRYDIVENIINGYQSRVGKAWNPFLMISDLMADETVGPKISYVDITPNAYMKVANVKPGERIKYSASTTITYK